MQYIFLAILLSGCVSQGPMAWRPWEHQGNMSSCLAMCDGRAAQYKALTGECKCGTKKVAK